MECSVCYCSINTQTFIKCDECAYQTCCSCVETYLLSITSDPHCMNCRCAWDILFLRKNLAITFMDGVFRQKRVELLHRRCRRLLNKEIMCPCPSCPFGRIIKSTMSCSSCWVKLCSDCLFPIPKEKIEQHSCHKEDILSLNTIQRTTKKCPSCHVPIEKKSGCFQMFCTQCYTAFDWNKNVLLEKKNLHNPHYFEYCFQPQRMITLLEQKIQSTTNPLVKKKYNEFYYLFQDIKKQVEFYSSPQQKIVVHSIEHEHRLYQKDLLVQQHQCQYRIWSCFYKRATRLLQQILSSSFSSSCQPIYSFQNDLKEKLLEYNEYVAECLQLRGYRLFECNPPL